MIFGGNLDMLLESESYLSPLFRLTFSAGGGGESGLPT